MSSIHFVTVSYTYNSKLNIYCKDSLIGYTPRITILLLVFDYKSLNAHGTFENHTHFISCKYKLKVKLYRNT